MTQVMKCISHNKGQFLCINRSCAVENSYVCSDPSDRCKEDHECCSLISLSYLLKKFKNETIDASSQKNQQSQLLFPLYDKAKLIAGTISMALASEKVIREIHNLLESPKPLTPEDKDKIAKFMNDRKIDSSSHNGLTYRIEKQLEEFQLLINQFNHAMKQIRNKEIEDLKKKLNEEGNGPPLPLQSRIVEQKVYNRERTKKIKDESKPKESKVSQNKKPAEGESPSRVINLKMSGLSNLEKEKNRQDIKTKHVEIKQSKAPMVIGPSPVKSRIPQGAKSGALKGLGFEQKINSILRHHVPKAPLHSKITNDIRTLNSFFQTKFVDPRLLYRASQNGFLASKFHELCDGHRNTLTLLVTEHEKVIGGFTPLPWKTGSGQWYEDQEERSFIFNLSSGQRYPLVSKQRAIWCSRNFGPSFGHPDLQIADKAKYNSNSCANFPMCYNNGNYKNTPGSTQLFCGTKNGHFRIVQWQVYELSFP